MSTTVDELPGITVEASRDPGITVTAVRPTIVSAQKSSFTKKQLRVTITLNRDGATFPGTNNNKLILEGMRVIATIQAYTSNPAKADISIFNMKEADMNALTLAFFNPPALVNNTVLLESNDGNGWSQAFTGMIVEAQPQYKARPNVFFHIQAVIAYFSQIAATAPASYPGPVDISQIVSDIAKKMDLVVELNGVSVMLPKSYYPGTLYQQLTKSTQDANVDFYISNGYLILTYKNKPRQNSQIVILNDKTGLVEWPVVEKQGLFIECLYNPAIAIAGKVTVDSSLTVANGVWTPYSYIHKLESERPKGLWLSGFHTYPAGP